MALQHSEVPSTDLLLSLQQRLTDAQWKTALLAAQCYESMAKRKSEMVDEVRPWTSNVETLFELSNELTEQRTIVNDIYMTTRQARHILLDEQGCSQSQVGADADEVKQALRQQDHLRQMLDAVEILSACCTAVSSQLNELEKNINVTVLS